MRSLKLSDLKHLKKVGVRPTGDEVYICPFCLSIRKSPDRVGHLFVNKSKWGGIYHCYRCGESGPLLGMLYPRKPTELLTSDLEKENGSIEMPPFFVSLKESTNDFFPYYKDYAVKRGLTKELISKFNVGFTVDLGSVFYGRLIFCFYDKGGELSFVQGRAVLKDIQPKYYSRGKKVLAKSFQGSVDSGLVSEGLFDMIKASKYIPSACLFTHRIRNDSPLIKELKHSFTKKIYLALDSDVPGSIIPFMKVIRDREIVPVFIPKKDIGELSDRKLKEVIDKIERL